MDYNPTVESKRLILRKITETDKMDLFDLLINSRIQRRMVWNHLNNMEDITQYIKEILSSYENNEPSCFAIELKESGKLVGIIEFINFKEEFMCLEVHYMLLPKHHNKGLMTEALIKIISFIFKETSINRMEAFCLKSNHASGKVLEKAGMHLEGIMREKIFIEDDYADLKFFSMIRSDIQYV